MLALAAGLSLAGGQALAQAADQLRAAVFARAPARLRSAAPTIQLAGAPQQRPAGVARTSLDHAFARSGVTGSLGFLCGLDERRDTAGAMGAFGTDPHGRFVGAQLHLSFR